jgi:hypothetical protein
MFIRALKAIVLPLVFVNVVISVVDMMSLGRASSVGWKTIGLYTLTTAIASVIGLIAIVMFKGKFEEGSFSEMDPAFVKLGCNADGQFLTEMDDGSVSCSVSEDETNTYFVIDDISGTFQRVSQGARNDISLSDTIYDGVFSKLITQNIFFSFVDSNFAAVIIFAIFAGVALGGVVFKRGITVKECSLVMVLTDMSDMFLVLINMVIGATPFAVFSLIANAVGSQDDLAGAFSNVGWLIAASLLGFMFHFLIVDVVLFYFLAKVNPFTYLRFSLCLKCRHSSGHPPLRQGYRHGTRRHSQLCLPSRCHGQHGRFRHLLPLCLRVARLPQRYRARRGEFHSLGDSFHRRIGGYGPRPLVGLGPYYYCLQHCLWWKRNSQRF